MLATGITEFPVSTVNSLPGSITAQVRLVGTPTVLSLQRFGFHAHPTTLVLTFSTALDPTRAQDLGNYRLVRLVHGGRQEQLIPLLSASFDPTTHAVTLTPAQQLPLLGSFVLTVNGTAPRGLTSATGVPLDGSGSGSPGTNFVQQFGVGAFVGAPNAAIARVFDQWAGQGPFRGLQFADPGIASLAAQHHTATARRG